MTEPDITIATLLARHAPDSCVAFGDGGARTASDLLADVAAVRDALPAPPPGSPGSTPHALLVFKNDRYAFATALLGAWSAGYPVALPANTRRDTVAALFERADTAALLHDTTVGLGIRVPPLLGTHATQQPPALPALAPGRTLATVYTSGSTGAAAAWPKTTRQLLGEVAVLQTLLGLADPAGTGPIVVPTVDPTHIYGLLFGVLLPLTTGGAFLRETPLLPEAIAARVRDHAASLLVTVPAHLRTFEALAPGALRPLERIISSTAPLPDATATMVAATHGLGVTELLGSTETGGIAWRERSTDPAWTPLHGVSLSVDTEQRLRVTSPFVDAALPQPYRTQDRAEAHPDGRITHLGRADDVVKIGGRRVSLRAMETALMRQPSVTDAAVLAVPDASGRSVRLVAIAETLTASSAALRAALLDHFEPSTVPRKIHTRRTLPRESNGKLQRTQALRAVGLGPDGTARAFALAWGRDAASPGQHVFDVVIPDNYAWYDGHFATYPVMAGAVQLKALVLPCVRRARPELGRVQRVSEVKFLGRLAPGCAATVTISWDDDPANTSVQFHVTEAGKAASGGKITFETPT